MFCSNCGCACADGTKFCSNCGATLQNSVPTPKINHTAMSAAPDGVSYASPVSAAAITIAEYYTLFPSSKEAKRQKTLKILFYISAVIQSALLSYHIAGSIYDSIRYLASDHWNSRLFILFVFKPLVRHCVLFFCTLYFTKTGIAKRSPTRLSASIILAFLSCFCCPCLRYLSYVCRVDQLIGIGIAVPHIIMLVINLKSVIEFKANAVSIQ